MWIINLLLLCWQTCPLFPVLHNAGVNLHRHRSLKPFFFKPFLFLWSIVRYWIAGSRGTCTFYLNRCCQISFPEDFSTSHFSSEVPEYIPHPLPQPAYGIMALSASLSIKWYFIINFNLRLWQLVNVRFSHTLIGVLATWIYPSVHLYLEYLSSSLFLKFKSVY